VCVCAEVSSPSWNSDFFLKSPNFENNNNFVLVTFGF